MDQERPVLEGLAKLRYDVIGAAIKVHNALGPGLLESVYETCLCQELLRQNIPFQRQVPFSILYEGVNTGKVFIADLVVDHQLLIELKSVTKLIPLHTAQTKTYLKLSGYPMGLIINFNTVLLKEGGLVKVELLTSSNSS